ncbi:MAG: MBL fold metallo-hydrolase [Dehalococcoidia bacterium]|nr:MBL fold metallo-hydrolase [Dehalococcoidia bacterium]
MRLTVLGSSASQPAAGDACSGYLVASEGQRVLLDCGSGVIGNLLQHAALSEIDAIFVSHMHPDHYIDLIAMRYGLRYGDGGTRPIDVFLPPGGAAQLQAVSEAISKTQPFFAGALNLHEYAPGQAVPLRGSFTVTPFTVVHGIPSHGMAVSDGVSRLVYSSDTVRCEELEVAARGADVLLAENALGGGAPDHHHPRTHMSAVEAGTVAANAGAGTLVLTHFWHTADRAQAQHEAESAFRGRVVIGRPHAQVDVGAETPATR